MAGGGSVYDALLGTFTDHVYVLERFQEWRESLPPMPTSRLYLSVFSHRSHV